MEARTKSIVLSTCSTLILAGSMVYFAYVLSMFIGLYKGWEVSGKELPLLTNFVFETYIFWWVFPIATLLVSVKAYKNKNISHAKILLFNRISIGGVILSIVLFFIVREAMYSPIMSYGKS